MNLRDLRLVMSVLFVPARRRNLMPPPKKEEESWLCVLVVPYRTRTVFNCELVEVSSLKEVSKEKTTLTQKSKMKVH